MDTPLISCLCVSQPSRWGFLQRAIMDFQNQTLVNKELIITVFDGDFAGLVDSFIQQNLLTGQTVKVFQRNARSQIDGLMWAAAQARGDLLTFWDDDNLNHPKRLEYQYSYQSSSLKPGSVTYGAMSVMAGCMYYFHDSNELYVVSQGDPGAPAAERCAVTTLMGPRDVFPPFEGQYRARPSAMLVNNLSKSGRKLMTIPAMTLEHLVGVHSSNLRTYDHLRKLATGPGSLSVAQLTERRDEITLALKEYFWDVPMIDVCGHDAQAFEVEARMQWKGMAPLPIADAKVEKITENLTE